jgi:hypothetical protein
MFTQLARLSSVVLGCALFSASFFSSPAHAMRCAAWVTHQGVTLCASWVAESACEENPRLCGPSTPTRPANNGNNGNNGTSTNVPTSGPQPATTLDDDQNPEKMSCRQLDRAAAAQDRALKKIATSITAVNEQLSIAGRSLDGPVSQANIDAALAESNARCSAWGTMAADRPVRICTERRGVEVCKNRALSASETAAFDACNASTKRYSNLVIGRSTVVGVQTKALAAKNALVASRDALMEYLKTLLDARDAKGCR